MTIVVGTDAYDTVANTDTYWADRGNQAWTDLSDYDKEIHLKKATDWIERSFSFRGKRETSDQRLAWPRELAFDDDGYQVGQTEAPLQVKEAMYIVADVFRVGAVDLEGVVTDDSAVKRQKVDVIEVEYDTTQRLRGEDVLTHVYKLLGPVVTANALLRS